MLTLVPELSRSRTKFKCTNGAAFHKVKSLPIESFLFCVEYFFEPRWKNNFCTTKGIKLAKLHSYGAHTEKKQS